MRLSHHDCSWKFCYNSGSCIWNHLQCVTFTLSLLWTWHPLKVLLQWPKMSSYIHIHTWYAGLIGLIIIVDAHGLFLNCLLSTVVIMLVINLKHNLISNLKIVCTIFWHVALLLCHHFIQLLLTWDEFCWGKYVLHKNQTKDIIWTSFSHKVSSVIAHLLTLCSIWLTLAPTVASYPYLW